jgi:ADP-ribosyl-[dinitrogen reductase] hydrolase
MSTTHDRALGCLVGLAVGDALGAPLEFSKRDSLPPVTGYRAGGPFNLKAGQWTDDTSCALALADTLLCSNGTVNADDFLMRLGQWYHQGKYSSTGGCFDIGNQTRTALEGWLRQGTKAHGAKPSLQGNGAIMRMAPVVLVARSLDEAQQLARAQTKTTHASPVCMVASKALASILWLEVSGEVKSSPSLLAKPRSKVKSSGHVKATMEAAAWCVERTSSFEEAVLLAANLGDDSDTVAAVTGQWAGARYGLRGIPGHLLEGLQDVFMVTQKAHELFALRERA